MRDLASVGKGGYTVTASIPDDIPAYCFALIDANGYMRYTDVSVAE